MNNLDTQISEMSTVRDQLHTQYQASLSEFQVQEQKFKEVESQMREKAEVGEPLKVKQNVLKNLFSMQRWNVALLGTLYNRICFFFANMKGDFD